MEARMKTYDILGAMETISKLRVALGLSPEVTLTRAIETEDSVLAGQAYWKCCDGAMVGVDPHEDVEELLEEVILQYTKSLREKHPAVYDAITASVAPRLRGG
jgi:hypothetical protein